MLFMLLDAIHQSHVAMRLVLINGLEQCILPVHDVSGPLCSIADPVKGYFNRPVGTKGL